MYRKYMQKLCILQIVFRIEKSIELNNATRASSWLLRDNLDFIMQWGIGEEILCRVGIQATLLNADISGELMRADSLTPPVFVEITMFFRWMLLASGMLWCEVDTCVKWNEMWKRQISKQNSIETYQKRQNCVASNIVNSEPVPRNTKSPTTNLAFHLNAWLPWILWVMV